MPKKLRFKPSKAICYIYGVRVCLPYKLGVLE